MRSRKSGRLAVLGLCGLLAVSAGAVAKMEADNAGAPRQVRVVPRDHPVLLQLGIYRSDGQPVPVVMDVA